MKTSLHDLLVTIFTQHARKNHPETPPTWSDVHQLVTEKTRRVIDKASPIPKKTITITPYDNHDRYIISGNLVITKASAEYNLSCLSPRKKELIEAFVELRTHKLVAERLVISPGTVKTYIKILNKTLGTHSIEEIIRYYLVANNLETTKDLAPQHE